MPVLLLAVSSTVLPVQVALRERGAAPLSVTSFPEHLAAQERTGASDSQEQDSTTLVTAARSWLSLVDSGSYAASLDSAGPLLRQMAGTASAWQQFIRQARAKFPGNPGASRVVVRLDPAYQPDAAPPGRYARITYRVGAAGATVPEFVVLVATPSGWRVVMYGTTER
jgi:hypothetical protein